MCFVSAWPTDCASIPMHWKIDSSEGAPLRLGTPESVMGGRRRKIHPPSSLESLLDADEDGVEVGSHGRLDMHGDMSDGVEC